MSGITDSDRAQRQLHRLLAGMGPVLDPVPYAFCRLAGKELPAGAAPLALFREVEGTTVILDEAIARNLGLDVVWLARRIILTVHSDLDAVGFLARIASALAAAGIPCNAVSGLHHDHLFVPPEDGEQACALLQDLQRRSAGQDTDAILYEVTVLVENLIASEWLEWMRDVHLPEVLGTGCFTGCGVTRLIEPRPANGREGFVIVYRSPSLDAYRDYLARHAPRLQSIHAERYRGRFEASRRVRQPIRGPDG